MVAGAGKVGLSADAWFGWDEETAFGTKVGPGGSTEFAYLLNESLRGDIQIRDVPNISLSHQDVAQTYKGKQIVEGDAVVAMVYEGFEHLLLHAMGEINDAGAGTSGTFSRNFDLADAGRFRNANSPSLSLHVSRGVVGSGSTNPSVFTYAGCVVDGASWRMSGDGHLEMTLSFFGREETLATSAQAFSAPPGPVVNATECAVTWGDVAIPVDDMTVEMRRNIDRDRFFFGSTLSEEPPMGKYAVTWNMTSEWDNEVRAGSTTMRADYAARTARALKFTFTSTDVIASTASQYYVFDLQIPGAQIRAFPPFVNQQGRVKVQVSGVGVDSNVATAPYELRIAQVTDATFAE